MTFIDNILSYLGFSSLLDLLVFLLVFCLSLSFHEAAHAWTAYRLGDDTAALQGRLTLNPLAHLDPIGTIAIFIAHIGWAKPVPVNPTRFDRKYTMKKGMMLTSLAGPVSNLLLAVAAALLIHLTWTVALIAAPDSAWAKTLFYGADQGSTIAYLVISFLRTLYFANILLAVFNLLPMPPLDGYKIFGSMLPSQTYFKIMRYERYIGLAFLLVFFMARGAVSTVLYAVQTPIDWVIWTPMQALFDWVWGITGLN